MKVNHNAIAAMVRAESALRRQPTLVTPSGWVYFIGAPLWPVIKIGWAINPNARLDTIRLLSPIPLHLLTGLPGTTKDEKAIHSRFAALRNHGEWFKFEGDLIDFYDEVRAKHGSRPWPAT